MDGEKKRWTVTYAKHTQKKRKVYQDGFLDLYASTNKMKLYDDCEKLLECRILRKDEIISSGETLTFSAYFVDIGDPEGDHGPNSSVPKTNSNSNASELRNTGAQKVRVRQFNLTPSKKIIQEFKNNELHKYGDSQSTPDRMEPSTAEWQILYTTQLTQKAKKYHDGFLQLSLSGSLGRKVMLFDESRKLLVSRFLKKIEVITSGESISLDGHLVEIGESVANHGQGKNKDSFEVGLGQRNLPTSDRTVRKEFKKTKETSSGAADANACAMESKVSEWRVLYTTHVTQKAKKYHDGFLRVAGAVSRGRQIMLYDASENLLNSRFLKTDEVIRSGDSIAFGAHLVDIGEPKGDDQDSKHSGVQVSDCTFIGGNGMQRRPNFLKANKFVSKGRPQNSFTQKEGVQPKSTDSTIDAAEFQKSVSTNKTFRNARQILSILQKPLANETLDISVRSDDETTRQVSSTKKLQHVPEDSRFQKVSTLFYGSREMGVEKSPELISPEVMSNCNAGKVSMDADTGNAHQSYSRNSLPNEAFPFDTPSSILCPCPEPVEVKRSSHNDLKVAREIDECPSFDLDFD